MITVLAHDGSLSYYSSGKGAQAQEPHLCECSSCDVACDVHSENQVCPHHEEGEGGLCISFVGMIGRVRCAWIPRYVSVTACAHEGYDGEPHECTSNEDTRDLSLALIEGAPRLAGAQKKMALVKKERDALRIKDEQRDS